MEQLAFLITGGLYDPYEVSLSKFDPTRNWGSYGIEQQATIAEWIYQGLVPNIIPVSPPIRR